MKLVFIAIIVIILIILILYKLFAIGSFDKIGITGTLTLKCKGDCKHRGVARITRPEDGGIVISVTTFMPEEIVGTPSYQGWLINRTTGEKINLGRMERFRAGEFRVNFENTNAYNGFNKIIVSQEDNPYDGITEKILLES